MRKLLLMGAIALMTSCGSTQNTTAIKNLKEQQKVLDLTAKLNKTQLDYEKEKVDYNELTEKAANVNADANIATTDFTATSPSSTVKDAKDTIKKLKEAKAINKKLAKSKKKLDKMGKKIAKLQSQIDKLNKKLKIFDKQ